MKTSELFETIGDIEFVRFELNLNEIEEGDARHVAQEVARRVGGRVTNSRFVFSDILSFDIQVPMDVDSPDTPGNLVQKVLRRLSRGKNRFTIPYVQSANW